MTKITENTIEEFTIELLEHLGYQYIYAPDIAPDASTSSATAKNLLDKHNNKEIENE